MVGKTESNPQLTILETPQLLFINIKHEFCVLASEVNGESVEKDFSGCYADFGRPSIPIRRMVGLVLLRQTYNLIDCWVESPYWQDLCGEYSFQTSRPMDSREFVHFRQRIGAEGAERLLKLSVELFGKEACDREVLIDSTVQEKSITYPTDPKLHSRMIKKRSRLRKNQA